MICAGLSVYGQRLIKNDSLPRVQKKFDQSELNSYRAESDFQYVEIKSEPNFIERAWNWVKKMIRKLLSWLFQDPKPAIGVLKWILRLVPYIALAVILWLILKVFLDVNTRTVADRAINPNRVNFSQDEALLEADNLMELLQNAISVLDYRLAIRYYYLFILQRLASKQLIIWQQEKTNEDYIRELTETELSHDFREATVLYDFVWYGNFEINREEFTKASTQFKGLLKKIDE